jgi:hypothetical protein
MTVNYPFTAAQDPLTGEYQQILHWTIKDKPARTITIQLLIIPLMILFGFSFLTLNNLIGKQPFSFSGGTFNIDIPEVGIGIAGIVATIVLHELVHGLVMRLCGAKSQYGVLWKQLMFYATCPGYGFRRNSYIMIALAPLIGISCLAVVGMFLLQGTNWGALLALSATINGCGAIGDMWIVSRVLHYPKTAYVVDERDGFRVLIRKA